MHPRNVFLATMYVKGTKDANKEGGACGSTLQATLHRWKYHGTPWPKWWPILSSQCSRFIGYYFTQLLLSEVTHYTPCLLTTFICACQTTWSGSSLCHGGFYSTSAFEILNSYDLKFMPALKMNKQCIFTGFVHE